MALKPFYFVEEITEGEWAVLHGDPEYDTLYDEYQNPEDTGRYAVIARSGFRSLESAKKCLHDVFDGPYSQ